MKKYRLLGFFLFFFSLLSSFLPAPRLFAQSDPQIFKNGVQAYKEGDYQKAIDALGTVIASEPDNLDAYRLRGSSFMKQNRYEDAVKDFEKAVQLAPDRDGVYSDLGTAWYYSKDYKKSLENYNIEIEKGHRNHLVFFNRALCLEQVGELDKALEDTITALEIKPDFYWGLCYKGNLLAVKKQYKKAAEAYQAAIRLNEKDTYAKEKLAQINDKQKKAPEKTIKQKPDSGWEIQTGAFRNPDNAEKQKSSLNKKGFNTRVLPIEDNDGNQWYLVRSGLYKSKKDAQKETAGLKNLGFDCMVRPSGDW